MIQPAPSTAYWESATRNLTRLSVPLCASDPTADVVAGVVTRKNLLTDKSGDRGCLRQESILHDSHHLMPSHARQSPKRSRQSHVPDLARSPDEERRAYRCVLHLRVMGKRTSQGLQPERPSPLSRRGPPSASRLRPSRIRPE